MPTAHAIAVISRPGHFSVRQVKVACDTIINSNFPEHIIRKAHTVRWAHAVAFDVARQTGEMD